MDEIDRKLTILATIVSVAVIALVLMLSLALYEMSVTMRQFREFMNDADTYIGQQATPTPARILWRG